MSVKKYSYKKECNVKLSPHISVKEIASIRGTKLYTDTVKFDLDLITMVEKLFSTLRASKVIISSGYRTPQHDKDIGGNGKGAHTQGKALDCCFYDDKNKIINAKYVCCIAQDIGFNGIANISNNFKYVHLDNLARIYKGDERYTNNTVTDNFYTYFGLDKNNVYNILGIKTNIYYKKYTGSSLNIDTVFKAIGVPTKYRGSYKSRRTIAVKNSIINYTGSLAQNLKLITLSKKGKLLKP